MANEITTDNINTKAQEVASIGDGDYVYIFKAGANTFARIEKNLFFQGMAGSSANAGSFVNVNGNTPMRLWVGTQEQLNALNNNYEDDVVYIVAEYVHGSSTTVPVTGVSISEGTRNGNNIRLTAVISPSNATDKSVTWTIDNTTDFSISPSSQSATLTVKDSATTAKSVTVTCTASNGVKGTLLLSLAYDGGSTAPTITQITYASAGENQLQFSATISDGSSIPVEWSASPSSVATIDASTGLLTILQSGTISVTATCTNNTMTRNDIPVTYAETTPGGEDGISATRTAANTMSLNSVRNGSTQTGATYSFVGTVPTVKHLENGSLADVPAATISGSTLSYKEDCAVTIQNNLGQTKTLNIVHDSGDYIWFEDNAVVTALNSLEIGDSNGITYGQAASVTKLQLINNTSIVRFNEFKHFTGIKSLSWGANTSRLNGNTNLMCIEFPSAFTQIVGNTASQAPLAGTAITELFVPSGAKLGGFALSGMASLVAISIDPADSDNLVNTFETGCTSLEEVIIRNTTTSLPSALFNGNATIKIVDFGENVSNIPYQCFRDCDALESLTLRYNGLVSVGEQAFYNVSTSNIDLYVPQSQISAYQSDSTFSRFKSINAISE